MRSEPASRAALCIGIGVVLRFALFAATAAHPERREYAPDSLDYERLAENLAAGRGFSLDASPPYRPDVLRTPLYPALLATIELLGGTALGAGAAAGVLLSCAAIPLAFAAARAWLPDAGPRVGNRAALFVSVDLGAAAYGNFLLTESLFVVLLLSAFALVPRAVRSGRFRDALLPGLFTAAAILCRPIALGIPIALSIGRRKKIAAGLLAGAAVILVPWIVRNGLAAEFWNVSSIADVNLYHHRAGAILDDRRGVTHDIPTRIPEASDARAVRRMGNAGWKLILDDPATFVRLTLFAWVRTFGPDEDPSFRLLGIPWEPGPWWLSPGKQPIQPRGLSAAENALEGAILLVVYAAAVRGWTGKRDPSRRALVWSAAAVVVYFLAVSGPEYYGRFRVPILPFVALMAEGAPRKMPPAGDAPPIERRNL